MTYTPTNWKNNDVIDSGKLNNIEGQLTKTYLQEIAQLNSQLYGDSKKYLSGLSFITETEPFRNATIQQVWYDVVNHDIYMTQTDNLNPEGFLISRMSSNGRYLDSMYFVGAGHGTQIIFKNRPKIDQATKGDVYVHVRYYDGTSDIYTTTYVANTTVSAKTDITKNATLLSAKTGQFAMFGDKMAQLADDGNLYFWEVEYNSNTGVIENKINSLITYAYLGDLPSDYVAQGISLISKESVTGNSNDIGKYLVIRLDGGANVRINLYFWEVDASSLSVKYIGVIEHLERSVIGNQTENGNNWLGDFEGEGLSTIEYSQDGMTIGGGLILGVGSGEIGYRSQYLYGILNDQTLSVLLSSAKTNHKHFSVGYDSTNSPKSYLYELIQHNQYFFNYGSPKTYTDLPDFLKNSTQSFDGLLINSKRNMQGSFVQTLKILYPKEIILERYLRRDVLSYGKTPLYNITPWRITSDSVSSGRDAKFIPVSGKLTDFAPVGMSVYLTRDQINAASDIGNLNSVLPVATGGGTLNTQFLNSTMVLQTFTHNASGTTIAKRRYSITPSVYGPGGSVSGTIGDWVV